MRHHAIVATSHNKDLAKTAHAKAVGFGCKVTDLIGPVVNGHYSFAIVPDGSKEGWGESNVGDVARAEWKAWADSKVYEDGSTSLEWVEVTYGESHAPGESYDSQIEQDCWTTAREKKLDCFARN